MELEERRIATAAFNAGHKTDLEKVLTASSTDTGIDRIKVKSTLEYLVSECVLKICATPVRDVDREPLVRDNATLIWYEKGKMWTDE
jgi:hypothetical protein